MSDLGSRVAEILVSLTSEHGAPNAFTAGEIASNSATLRAVDVGRAIRCENYLIDTELRKHGLRFAGWDKGKDGTWLHVESVKSEGRS